ncbi:MULTISPECIES: hypothetical protein [unclassified Sphingomonas]|uniref:hypothetical protein n=1 Tax=unclassified Sphingomonas TaxID=196159 RepID=UPI002269FD5F|nr:MULTISPECIES: hypothetical protein [unclassified Sphingomonas]
MLDDYPIPAAIPLPDAARVPADPLGDEPSATDSFGRAMRHDGWTPGRQRRFLEFIADGHTVDHAAQMVGLTATSAYALRRRPAGAGFALGWRAANLVARDHLADTMLARALHGSTETITRPDGSTVERHRLNDRLGLQLLAQLDRQAEAAATPGAVGEAAAARLVAGDFETYLDLVAGAAGPARAGLFLAARTDAAADLADIAALARADRARRALPDGTGDDLDPAERHRWTAEQWARAEAAGLIALAPPPPEPAPEPEPEPAAAAGASQLPQLVTDAAAQEAFERNVWWSSEADDYRTHFPPPDDFLGDEQGSWGDDDYERALSDEERALLDLPEYDPDRPWLEAAAERDAWFAANAVTVDDDPAPDPAPDPVAGAAAEAVTWAAPSAGETGTPPSPAR